MRRIDWVTQSDGSDPDIPDEDAIERALAAAIVFWRSLGEDNDVFVEDLLTPTAITYLGPGPGIAERLRSVKNIRAEDCLALGWASQVDILENGDLRFWFADETLGHIEAGKPILAWRIEAVRAPETESQWLLDPIRAPTLEKTGDAHMEELGGGQSVRTH